MSESLYDIPLEKIDGTKATLAEHRGNVLLVVNVASKCGLTPQYEGLEKLHETYGPKGLVVLGVPSNDFGAQEPRTEPEIAKFCETMYGVKFPLTSKQKVIGPDAHALYRWIAQEAGEGAAPKWNIHKYLIGKDGILLVDVGHDRVQIDSGQVDDQFFAGHGAIPRDMVRSRENFTS